MGGEAPGLLASIRMVLAASSSVVTALRLRGMASSKRRLFQFFCGNRRRFQDEPRVTRVAG